MTLEEAILKDTRITNVICRITRTNMQELTHRHENGKLSRNRNVAEVRQVIYFFYREFFPQVALKQIPVKTLGIKQDHSTVINAITKVKDRVDSEKPFRVLIARLRVLIEKHLKELKANEITPHMVMLANQFENVSNFRTNQRQIS